MKAVVCQEGKLNGRAFGSFIHRSSTSTSTASRGGSDRMNGVDKYEDDEPDGLVQVSVKCLSSKNSLTNRILSSLPLRFPAPPRRSSTKLSEEAFQYSRNMSRLQDLPSCEGRVLNYLESRYCELSK